MGIFQHKQDTNKKTRSPIVEVYENEKNFFDEEFRQQIRTHASSYFEEIIKENVVIFKQDLDAAVQEISTDLKAHTIEQLDATIAKVNGELKDHATKQLDERFAEYGKEMKEAQDATLASLTKTAENLQGEYAQLSDTLKKTLTDQDALLNQTSKSNLEQLAVMKQSQDAALKLLNDSAAVLQDQYQQLRTMLQKNIVDQENMILSAFQDNMAQIVEHYLLGAMGDQFDLKAQLPSIIKQMEANKEAIAEDMKL